MVFDEEQSLGSQLRMYRIARGIKQKELAKTLNMSAPTLSQIEHENRRPTRKQVQMIAELLDLPPSFVGWYMETYQPGSPAPKLEEIIRLVRRYPKFTREAKKTIVQILLVLERDYEHGGEA